jgi:hypothetical protein
MKTHQFQKLNINPNSYSKDSNKKTENHNFVTLLQEMDQKYIIKIDQNTA